MPPTSGEAFCERSGFDTPEKCHACGDCCRWDYLDDGCYYNDKDSGPSANCPRNDGPEEPNWDAINDDEGYYGPDKCVYGDRECSDCNCASCNLCVDNYGLSGSFCTTSAAQMTIACCFDERRAAGPKEHAEQGLSARLCRAAGPCSTPGVP